MASASSAALERRVGKRLRLLVVAILQPVLDVAQERGTRRAAHATADARQQSPRRDRVERGQRAADAKRRLASAAHDLQRLHDELDLADAAFAELDVARVVAARALLADLAMHVAQARVRVVVEILAVHERRHERHRARRAAVAGQRPRLEPRVALPRAALRDQVLLERGVGDGQRTGIAVRPQPHVDAEHEAVGGHLVQRGDHAASEPLEELAVAEPPRARGLAFLRIDEDEVDVGRHVELAAAELAHRDDHEPLRRSRVRTDRFAELARKRCVVQAHCGIDRNLGEPGDGAEALPAARRAA